MPMSGAARRRLKKIRAKRAKQQKWLCHWCRLPMLPVDATDPELRLTADHVKPVARGGKTQWWNVVAAHALCNNNRSNGKPPCATATKPMPSPAMH
jgi:5-methylcytosine-specific restriction endonuclease McrA